MTYDILTVLKLAAATFFPVALAALLYLAERRTAFGRENYWVRQAVTGVVFGGAAVLATAFGIPLGGAMLNVRNAAPLTAGLLFGGPAGILAGVIGGVYRWFAAYFGAGEFSQLACTLACMLAGVFGAGCRRFMFDNKKASWFYGLIIGGTTEVLHMLLIFITNMDDVYGAYRVVALCAVPMILCNAVSVMLSLLLVALMGKERIRKPLKNRQISQIFQFLLLICVVIAFAVTTAFTSSLQTRIAYASADGLLRLNLEDVEKDIREASDSNLLRIARLAAAKVTPESTREELLPLLAEYNIAGINIVDSGGVITESTLAEFVGYDMSSGAQSAEFLCLLHGTQEFVQSYQPLAGDSSISRKYAGIAFPEGGFLQVGYDAEQFQSSLTEEIRRAVVNRHIGQAGGVIVCNGQGEIIYDNGGHTGESIYAFGNTDGIRAEPGVRFTADIGDTKSLCMFSMTEGFYLIANLPADEAMFSRDIAVTILAFMETVVFAALFAHIYFLIKKLIVDNIHKINGSLSQITGGDLNVHVNVRENEEFASLSDDINATVDTLKRYIAEAESRIDRELEFARQIQCSSLPSVFPPYPERRDFGIFASMDAAREVGGDFYDFCLTDPTHLMFLVADVSGKGIPGALFMMRAKTLIKNLVESGKSIDEVFTEANRGLCENNEAEMFVTAWMGLLDTETGLLQYVNAGHNPPLVRRRDGTVEYLRTRPNFILAGMEMTRYRKHELQLEKGDGLFVYTDGVTEAADTGDRLYGEERLRSVVAAFHGSPEALCRTVRADIGEFTKGAEQSDDITMLCVNLNPDGRCASRTVTPDRASIEAVTEFVSETLEQWEIPMKLAGRAQIAVDEIYSNIVYYSGASSATVTVSEDGEGVTLRFSDDGKPYDPTTAKEPDITLSAEEREIGGLGIFMVKKMAAEISYRYEDGKNILCVGFAG